MAHTVKNQIRKALLPSEVVTNALNKQKAYTPGFFLENGMRFDILAESIAIGHRSKVIIHLNGIIAASIQDDVDLHLDFLNMLNALKY